jgi:hypothetical protein
MEEANQKNLEEILGEDIKKGDQTVKGHPSNHERLAPKSIGKAPKEGLDQELADGKPGDNQPKLEITGSLFGDVDRKKGYDEPQPHDYDRPRQDHQDQFFPEDAKHGKVLIFLIQWVKIFFDRLLIYGGKEVEVPIANIKLTYHKGPGKVN